MDLVVFYPFDLEEFLNFLLENDFWGTFFRNSPRGGFQRTQINVLIALNCLARRCCINSREKVLQIFENLSSLFFSEYKKTRESSLKDQIINFFRLYVLMLSKEGRSVNETLVSLYHTLYAEIDSSSKQKPSRSNKHFSEKQLLEKAEYPVYSLLADLVILVNFISSICFFFPSFQTFFIERELSNEEIQ